MYVLCVGTDSLLLHLPQDYVMECRVLSDLLFKDDQLVNDLAESLETTSIQGGCVLGV